MSEHKPRPPIPDELLDKGIGLLEGPLNRAAERVLGSTLVLAPRALTMTTSMRVMAMLRGTNATGNPTGNTTGKATDNTAHQGSKP